ncbi:MAG: hypothetical protein WA840_06460 [Caulobacteraceae bacterium]
MNGSALARTTARVGACFYVAWGIFHVKVARDIYLLGVTQKGIAQGRTFQLAAYMLCIALTAVVVAVVGNAQNRRWAYWFNLGLMGWADGVWTLVVVFPGYVPLFRGLVPPAIFLAGAIITSLAYFRFKPAADLR